MYRDDMKRPQPHPTPAPTVLMVIHTCLLSAGLSFDKGFQQDKQQTTKLVNNLHSTATIAADPWVLQLIGLYAQSRVNELHLRLHEAHAQQSSHHAAH